jgi:hypothetical protein
MHYTLRAPLLVLLLLSGVATYMPSGLRRSMVPIVPALCLHHKLVSPIARACACLCLGPACGHLRHAYVPVIH